MSLEKIMNALKKLVATALLLAASAASAQLASSHAATMKPAGSDSNVALHAVGRPIVKVNGATLTDTDLVREMYTIFPYARQHNGTVPKAMEADIRAGAFKMMIFEELVYQEARRRNMTIPPARLDKAMREFRTQFGSPEQYRNFLQQEFGGSEKAARAKVERSLLIDKFLTLEVANKSAVTLVQEKAFYDKHPERFRVPESYAFQSISILPPQNATPDQLNVARKRAQEALQKAKATTTYDQFGLLAEKMSDDDFRVVMGDHKAVDRSKLPQTVLAALAGMKPGEVSGIIEFDKNYFTILRLNSHIPAGEQSFAAIKDNLRESMQKDKTEQLRSALATSLSKNAKIEKL